MIALLFALSARADDLDALWASLAAPDALTADFTQTLHRQVLKKPFQTTGRVEFRRPRHVVWAVDAPTPSVFTMDGDDLTLAYPALGVSESLSLRDRPDYASLVGALTVWLGGDLAQARGTWDVALVDGSVVLKPRGAPLDALISELALVPSADGRYVERMRLTEPDGDRSEIAFANVRLTTP